MCGRYATSRSAADLSALFEAADETGGGVRPDYNVAPTRDVPVVRMSRSRGARVLGMARWGLVPAWAADARSGARMINARVERVATAPAFRSSFARRRCLVPADGWYEWCPREDGRGRQPYFMTPRRGGGLAFAGIWSVWGEQRLYSCAVLTMPARGELARVHDRMPLVLPPDRWAAWLAGPEPGGPEPGGPEAGGSAAGPQPGALLAPPPDELLADLEIRPVGAEVGDVRSAGPELTAPVRQPVPDLTLF